MTVIAWDGKTLAADKRCSYGGMVCTVTKIFRVGDLLVGGSGDFPHVLAMVDWLRRGRDASNFPAAQRDKDDWQTILVIEPDGKALIYERTPYPTQYEQDCMTIGSGREYARAALYMGATAAEAVAVASALDCNCGNSIDTLQLKPKEEMHTLRIPFGTFDHGGKWTPNTAIAMSADEQYLHNVKHGFIKEDLSFPFTRATT